MIHDVVKAEYIDGYRIEVTFDDGRSGTVDFSSYIGVGGVDGSGGTGRVTRVKTQEAA